MSKISIKDNKGVTLVALVVTILVMIIIAGVSISMLTQEDNSIIKNANKASEKSSHESVRSAVMAVSVNYTDYDEFEQYMSDNNYMDSNGVINVSAMVDNANTYGIGSNFKNVYIVETHNTKTFLYYYDENGNAEELIDLALNAH